MTEVENLQEETNNLFSEFEEDNDKIIENLEDAKLKHEIGLDYWCYNNKGYWIQSIKIDGIIFGCQWNNDGSIFCLLCMIDDHITGSPIHHTITPIHTNEEFINHIRFGHMSNNPSEKLYWYSEVLRENTVNIHSPPSDNRKPKIIIDHEGLAVYLKQKIKRMPLDNDARKCEAVINVDETIKTIEKCNNITEVVEIHGYVVGIVFQDTDLISCYLCMLDKYDQDIPIVHQVHHYKRHLSVHSDDEFTKHIVLEHHEKGKPLSNYQPQLMYNPRKW